MKLLRHDLTRESKALEEMARGIGGFAISVSGHHGVRIEAVTLR